MKKNTETVVDLLLKSELDNFGSTSITLTSTGAVTVPSGMAICCIKPLGGTATIASASDPAGTAIAGLVGVILLEGNEYLKNLSALNFSAIGVAVEVYFKQTPSNFAVSVG